jgi:hypothetical protein
MHRGWLWPNPDETVSDKRGLVRTPQGLKSLTEIFFLSEKHTPTLKSV